MTRTRSRIGQIAGLFSLVCLGLTALQPAAASTISVVPIQVCDVNGGNCGDPLKELFEQETGKIWAQAGIDVSFLTWGAARTTTAGPLNVNSESLLYDLFSLTPGYPETTTVFMWFVPQISWCGATVSAYGCSLLSGNQVAIANAVFSYNSGLGRIDTIAHELGHVLGLEHCNDEYGLCDAGTSSLMMSGVRAVPTSISNIYPGGAMRSQLSEAEIAVARSSPFAVPTPEPGTMLLSVVGVSLFLFRWRFTGR